MSKRDQTLNFLDDKKLITLNGLEGLQKKYQDRRLIERRKQWLTHAIQSNEQWNENARIKNSIAFEINSNFVLVLQVCMHSAFWQIFVILYINLVGMPSEW